MIRRIIRKLITFSGLNPKPVNITAKISLTYPSEKLRHKKIVITGGTKGLGLAMAVKFKQEGAMVLITGRDSKFTEDVANREGLQWLKLNLQDTDSFDDFLKHAVEKLGGIDCLVNNAGISLHEASFFDVTPESFDAQFSTNLKGTFFLTQKVTRHMCEQGGNGNILFVSSETGFTADVRPYGLTKASLNSLIQGLAFLLCDHNIRVNAIAPGVVATDMTGFSPKGNLEYGLNSIGRLYLPEEMAEVAAFILSDESFALSGQIIGCNNARTINARWK